MENNDCLFCKIVNREIPSSIVYQDHDVVAFNDINPQAPVHIVIVPRVHIERISEVGEGQIGFVGRMILVANKIAQDKDIVEPGYRLIINNNAGAGQSIYHIHLHLLGGRRFSWPPG